MTAMKRAPTLDAGGRLLLRRGTGPDPPGSLPTGSAVGDGDDLGQPATTYRYDPFGVTAEAEGPLAATNPWRYTGAYLDATGLYKLGERYYDPNHGRFTQQDPIVSPADPMHWNRYVYVGNNPINYTDPTGRSPWDTAECMAKRIFSVFDISHDPSWPLIVAGGGIGHAGVLALVDTAGATGGLRAAAMVAGVPMIIAGAGLIGYGLYKQHQKCR